MKFASRRATVVCAAFVLQFGVSHRAQSEPAIGGIGGPLLSGIVAPKTAASNSAPTDPTYMNCTKPFGGGQQPAVIVSQCTALINANKLAPEYLANVFYHRGNAFFAQQEYYTAQVDYASAIRLNPKYSKAYNNRAFANIKQGNYAAAIPDLNQAIALDPAYLQAYRNRAQAYAKTGDLTRAKGDYDQAIALDPKDGETYYNRGVVNYQSGRFADAVEDYDRALQFNPSDRDAANNRVLAQQALTKAKQMYADQEAARKKAETDAIVNAVAGVATAMSGGAAMAPASGTNAASQPQQKRLSIQQDRHFWPPALPSSCVGTSVKKWVGLYLEILWTNNCGVDVDVVADILVDGVISGRLPAYRGMWEAKGTGSQIPAGQTRRDRETRRAPGMTGESYEIKVFLVCATQAELERQYRRAVVEVGVNREEGHCQAAFLPDDVSVAR